MIFCTIPALTCLLRFSSNFNETASAMLLSSISLSNKHKNVTEEKTK